MPTYSYACTECDNRFDAVQAFTDDAFTECPRCSGRLRKLFGKVGVVFKGTGFYRTDSRAASNGSSNGEKKATADSPSSSSSSGSSSDSSSTPKSNGDAKSSATPAPAASAS